MIKLPNFSVLMSVYFNDDVDCFRAAIQSILVDQTLKPTELVLVTDGPLQTELDEEIFKWSVFPCLKLVQLSKNVGLAKALNKGLEHCSYEIVCRMDADDIAVKDRFEKQLSFICNNPKVGIVGGQIREFEGSTALGTRSVPLHHNDIVKFARFRCPFNHPTVLLNLSSIGKNFRYCEEVFPEDYVTWLKVLNDNISVANIPDILVLMRTNKAFFNRRRGFEYMLNELRMLTYARKMKLMDFHIFVLNAFGRSLVRVIPISFLKFFYHKLRHRP